MMTMIMQPVSTRLKRFFSGKYDSSAPVNGFLIVMGAMAVNSGRGRSCQRSRRVTGKGGYAQADSASGKNGTKPFLPLRVTAGVLWRRTGTKDQRKYSNVCTLSLVLHRMTSGATKVDPFGSFGFVCVDIYRIPPQTPKMAVCNACVIPHAPTRERVTARLCQVREDTKSFSHEVEPLHPGRMVKGQSTQHSSSARGTGRLLRSTATSGRIPRVQN